MMRKVKLSRAQKRIIVARLEYIEAIPTYLIEDGKCGVPGCCFSKAWSARGVGVVEIVSFAETLFFTLDDLGVC